MRIVSLLPSATEIICGLGLQNQLVGVTHECDFPHGIGRLPVVTETRLSQSQASKEIDKKVREQLQHDRSLYLLKCDALQQLRPDLIVTQTLCDVCAVSESSVRDAIGALVNAPQIIKLEPTSLSDVLEGIRQVGDAADQSIAAERYVASLQDRIAQVALKSRQIQTTPSVVLLEWIDPLFSAGHWNPELVKLAGGEEKVGKAGKRSGTLSPARLAEIDPEILVIACCGFDEPRARQDLPILRSINGWSDLRCVKNRRVYLVDGSAYFNRPGPRLVDSLEILAHAIHPSIHSIPAHLSPASRV